MHVLFMLGALLLQTDWITVFDFSEADQAEVWTVVDDQVMGGISQGQWYQEDAYVVFTGDLSLENNGGFSSARVAFRPADISAFDGVVLQVRGDARTYEFGLRDARSRYDHRASFETTLSEDGDWQTVVIPFDVLVPTYFGRENPAALPFDPSVARGMNIILTDGQAGVFRLEIASIGLYRDTDDSVVVPG